MMLENQLSQECAALCAMIGAWIHLASIIIYIRTSLPDDVCHLVSRLTSKKIVTKDAPLIDLKTSSKYGASMP